MNTYAQFEALVLGTMIIGTVGVIGLMATIELIFKVGDLIDWLKR